MELFSPSETVSRTTYWPGLVNVWDGFAAVDEAAVAEVPRVGDAAGPRDRSSPRSRSSRASGAGPDVLFAEASATGAWLDCR